MKLDLLLTMEKMSYNFFSEIFKIFDWKFPKNHVKNRTFAYNPKTGNRKSQGRKTWGTLEENKWNVKTASKQS